MSTERCSSRAAAAPTGLQVRPACASLVVALLKMDVSTNVSTDVDPTSCGIDRVILASNIGKFCFVVGGVVASTADHLPKGEGNNSGTGADDGVHDGVHTSPMA